MIDSYIKKRNEKIENTKERDNWLFGICLGFIIFLSNLYLFLERKHVEGIFGKDQINLIFMSVGLLLILLATVFPNSLKFLHFLFRKLFNLVGGLIFTCFLTIVYFIFVCPIGLIMKKRNEKNERKDNTNFVNYESDLDLNFSKKGFYNVLYIFKIFANEKYALMLPLVIVLIIIGILLIFVQSSIVTPFIYTLF